MGTWQSRRGLIRATTVAAVGACWCAILGQPVRADFVQATYLGGRGRTGARAAAVDPSSGDIILAGNTSLADIPGTAGGAQSDYAGEQDVWVARLSADLRAVKQATYLGGSAAQSVGAVAIDPASGDVLVAGYTSSVDFPGTAGGAQSAPGGGSDAFVARLSADLGTLVQATYLGGSGDENEALLGLAVDPSSGDVVIAGSTTSNDFPAVASGAQKRYGGAGDGFVARLHGDLQTLVRATYLGGSGEDVLYDVVVNPKTAEVIAAGAFTVGGARFGIVDCLSSDLRAPKGTAYVAISGTYTNVWGLATDPKSGDVVAAGETAGALDGAQGGAQPTFGGGGSDAFAIRLTEDLFQLDATYFGGGGSEAGIVKPMIQPTSGDVLIAGGTLSADLPAAAGGTQPQLDGASDGFVARFAGNLSSLKQATYVGGSGNDAAVQLAGSADAAEIIVVGSTQSPDFPATAGGAQALLAAPPAVDMASAAFAVEMDAALTGSSPTPATPTPAPATPTASPPPGTSAPGCTGDCGHIGQVTITDLITGVDIALGNTPLAVCPVFDANGDGRVTVDDLIKGVTNALDGCR